MSVFPPPEGVRARARVQSLDEYQTLYRRSVEDPEGFWRDQGSTLQWFHEPADVYESSAPGEFTWFSGGRLNVAVNCIDRHAFTHPDRAALVWAKNEPDAYETITFLQLKQRVGRVANLLRSLGVKKGDRVCLYMPMTPDVVTCMLACARIGAVHSVVFAGFSADALRDRILDAGARILITADEGMRGSKRVPLKAIADQACEGLDIVETVLVSKRSGAQVPMKEGRDLWLHEEAARHRVACPAEWMASEDPLFILYTSGSTGRPKGLVHTTAGYLTYATTTFRYLFDCRPGDVHFCAADVGWITGHTYIVYGPLAAGITTVIFESVPTFPDAGRLWEVVDDVQANTLYTSPTALRALRREGDQWLEKSSRSSLRILGTVGEPINPDVWVWYYEKVGGGRCPVIDTWWQTETGGVLIAPLPGATPTKPGSATLPMFGVRPVVVDAEGNELHGATEGLLCLEGSWPGQARTIQGDHDRYLKTYFSPFPGRYFTGDGCRRDEDGYYWITGRVDDVLNVSGHRLGTAEIESAIVAHDAAAEAAVVPLPHEIKGEGIMAFVIATKDTGWSDAELAGALKEQVRHVIGPIATPDRVLLVPGLPKTRSGKVMRRVLRKLAAGERDPKVLGDLSTLAEPGIVDAIVERLDA